MHRVNPKYFLIVFLVFIVGCTPDEPEIKTVNSEFIVLGCLFKKDVQFIIDSEEEYLQMARQIYDDRFGMDCVDTTQAPFNFNEYILCGKYTRHDMNDVQTNGVFQDDILKKIIYKIEIDIIPGPENDGGYGQIYSRGMNWVKIPKPPEGYKVVIEYREF